MNRHYRFYFISTLALFALFCCAGANINGQTTEHLNAPPPQIAANTHGLAPAVRPLMSRIVPLRLSDMPDGTRVTIASDTPLDDYTSRLEGDNFYVLIPHAHASSSQTQIAGRGFTSAQIEQRGDDVLLSFRLQRGASVRLNKGFNRLDVIFKTPLAQEQPQQQPADTSAAPSRLSSETAETTHANGAAATGSSDEREMISQMRLEIEALEARIRDIEARQAAQQNSSAPQQQTAQAAPVDAAIAVNPAPAQDDSTGGHDDHDEIASGPPRLQIQGFADVNFRATNQRERTNAFTLGQLDLFITSRLSEKFSVLGELIVEAGEDNAFSFEIHRLLLRYAPNDSFNVSVGRYHTSIGYYNTAYHHGSWFQTAVNRPFIFAFEGKGGILPLHNVGLTATGRIPSAPFGLRYVAEIGNGRASRSPLDRAVQTAVDENNGKAVNFGLFARPASIPGLQTGFSIYRDRLTPNGAPKVGQTITAAHLIYQNRFYEFLNEAVVVRHTSNGSVFHTPGFYTQFSRSFGNARPYFRYQYVNTPGDDPIFSNVGRRNGPSLGLRYDISEFAAFKAQYDRTQRRRLSALDELILQLAFTF